MTITDVIRIFVSSYVAQVVLLWGLLEGYTYFRGDHLKQAIGPYWILLLYGLPAVVSIGIACIQTLKRREHPGDHQVVPSGQEEATPESKGLSIATQRTEYTNFMAYNPAGTSLPIEISGHAFGNSVGGLVTRPISPKRLGFDANKHPANRIPHIPEGEVIIDFTLSHQGDTAVVNRITLEILDVFEKPRRCQSAGYMPVLDPIEDSAVIERGVVVYDLFKHKTFAYKDGDVDLFRVNVLISDHEKPCVFRFQVKVEYTVASVRHVAYSEPYFLAKTRRGMTPRIPYSKRPAGSAGTEKSVEGNTGPARPVATRDFDTDGRFLEFFLNGRSDEGPPLETCTDYIEENALQAIMPESKRPPLLQNGFTEVADLSSFGLTPVEGTPNPDIPVVVTSGEWVIAVPAGERGYSSTIHTSNRVEVYEGRHTAAYDRLCQACRTLSRLGTIDQHREAVEMFLNLVKEHRWDIAALYDVLPLLSLFRNQRAYDFITTMLYCNNPIIVDRAAEILASIRYSKAIGPLLDILREKQKRAFDTRVVLSAVSMNGDMNSVGALTEIYDSEVFIEGELPSLAKAIVKLSPRAVALDVARKYVQDASKSRRRISYLILKMLKGAND